MIEILTNSSFVLTEASVVERLRRNPAVQLDPLLANSGLIYNNAGRRAMADIYNEYLKIAKASAVLILLLTPTWRSNLDRVKQSGICTAINRDAVSFMRKTTANSKTQLVLLAGMIGCKNDSYCYSESLSESEAAEFHEWQIRELSAAKADLLIAQTLPAVSEAKGIAVAMSKTDLEYIISFVIDKHGRVLDGTPLTEAIKQVNSYVIRKPIGYFVNCSYPSFLNSEVQDISPQNFLLGFQGNGSSLSAEELDGSQNLHSEPIEEWGQAMLSLHRKLGVKVLGGCCGTEGKHLQYLVDNI